MEVYALVGRTGTGKSHHASLVAHRYGIRFIIDDGLLIHGSKILAGVSAKREATALAAVRRAIFHDPAHAREVKMVLREYRPDRLLVLGTSRDMIEKICNALDLPHPEKYIEITDVATPEEIRKARRVRRVEGKHVIPAPTFEVRRAFSGYMVDPLRFLYAGRSRRAGEVMIEKSAVRPTFSSLGRFVIADSVVAAIAQRAVLDVDGVVGCSHASVQSRPEGVIITLDLVLRYGIKFAPVLREAQARAKETVESLTALNVISLEVVARRVVPPDQLQ